MRFPGPVDRYVFIGSHVTDLVRVDRDHIDFVAQTLPSLSSDLKVIQAIAARDGLGDLRDIIPNVVMISNLENRRPKPVTTPGGQPPSPARAVIVRHLTDLASLASSEVATLSSQLSSVITALEAEKASLPPDTRLQDLVASISIEGARITINRSADAPQSFRANATPLASPAPCRKAARPS